MENIKKVTVGSNPIDLVQRHRSNRKKTNQLLTFTSAFAILYLFTSWSWLMIMGTIYIVGVLFLSRQKSAKLYQEYANLEQQCLSKVQAAIDKLGISTQEGKMSFGYHMTKNKFAPVFLYCTRDAFYMFDNVFIKRRIYTVANQTLFLFDIYDKAFKSGFTKNHCADLCWLQSEENHQLLLYNEGLRLQDTNIYESFIYDDILHDMIRKVKKRPVNIYMLLNHTKKEKVYSASVEDGSILLLAEDTAKRLGISDEVKS